MFAGFVISNSETGCGAFTITPRLLVQVCRNGMGHHGLKRVGRRNNSAANVFPQVDVVVAHFWSSAEQIEEARNGIPVVARSPPT
ncbi:hypothetical protein [Microbispora bryophytorum]|uniref:hypothetical protein n=1 Tax=Microbispora bryophytorum TaxID=1460882 RepID=UPI0033CB810C